MLRNIVLILILLTAITALELTIFIFYNRKKLYLKGFFGLVFSVFIYSLFYYFELMASNVQTMKVFAAIQYIGILSIPAFWVVMALEYTNKSKYLTRKLYIGLWLLPVILWVLNVTNEHHHLFYINYSATFTTYMAIAKITPGIGYTIAVFYVNVCLILGNIMYIQYCRIGSAVFKKRSLVILVTSFGPWIGYWMYMFGILPVKIDIIPILMEIICLIYTYALFKSNIFETVAIARHYIIDSISEAILVLDMENTLLDMNKRAEELFNCQGIHSIGQNIYKVFPRFELLKEYIDHTKEATFDFEMEVSQKTYYFQGEKTYIHNGENKGKIIVFNDNTEQVLLIKKLQYYGKMDILTGVYNRNYFHFIAKEKVKHCAEQNYPISCIMFDLDKFKDINDTYGHAAGDLVLKETIAVCKECLGEKLPIGRYGGEEFVIILENLEKEKTLEIAEKLRVKIMNLTIYFETEIIQITASFGIFTSTGVTELDLLVKKADAALYRAKRSGRNQICVI